MWNTALMYAALLHSVSCPSNISAVPMSEHKLSLQDLTAYRSDTYYWEDENENEDCAKIEATVLHGSDIDDYTRSIRRKYRGGRYFHCYLNEHPDDINEYVHVKNIAFSPRMMAVVNERVKHYYGDLKWYLRQTSYETFEDGEIEDIKPDNAIWKRRLISTGGIHGFELNFFKDGWELKDSPEFECYMRDIVDWLRVHFNEYTVTYHGKTKIVRLDWDDHCCTLAKDVMDEFWKMD